MKPISSFATISSTAIRERWQHERKDNAVVREPISDSDVEHRVIAIGNDVDPKVVITGHHSEFKLEMSRLRST